MRKEIKDRCWKHIQYRIIMKVYLTAENNRLVISSGDTAFMSGDINL